MASRPDEIAAQIALSRYQLRRDVDALVDRVSPSSVANRQLKRWRPSIEAAKRAVGDAPDRARRALEASPDVARQAWKAAPDRARSVVRNGPGQARQLPGQAREALRRAPDQARQAWSTPRGRAIAIGATVVLTVVLIARRRSRR